MKALRNTAALLLVAACTDGPTHVRDLVVVPPPVPVARVVLAPATIFLAPGDSIQLRATPEDSNHLALPGRQVSWSVKDPSIASISPTGMLTGLVRGGTVVMARCDSVAGTAPLDVRRNVYSILVSPPSLDLAAGDTVRLVDSAMDTAGTVIAGQRVSWFTSNPAIATVDTTGLVRGISAGRVKISVTAELMTASADLSVHAAGPPLAVGGLWDWTETFTDGVTTCVDTGSYQFNQAGMTFGGTSWQVGGCAPVFGQDSSRVDDVSGGTAFSDGMAFDVGNGSCHYLGTPTGSPATHLAGTAQCGTWTGTWDAVPAGPGDVVRVRPYYDITIPVGAVVNVYALVFNAAGRRAFGRPLTWSVPPNAAITLLGSSTLVQALAPGQGTVVAQAGTASGQAVVEVRQGFRVVDSLGDTFGTSGDTPYDLRYVAATRDSQALTIVLGTTQLVDPSDFFGDIDIDIDEDPTTGTYPIVDMFGPPGTASGLGDEYYIDVNSSELVNTMTGNDVIVPEVIQDSTITLRVPTAVLQGSNGYVGLAAVVGNYYEPTDIIPNTGNLKMTGAMPLPHRVASLTTAPRRTISWRHTAARPATGAAASRRYAKVGRAVRR